LVKRGKEYPLAIQKRKHNGEKGEIFRQKKKGGPQKKKQLLQGGSQKKRGGEKN